MSDLTAFTTYMSVAGMFAGIDPLTPIDGSGSLSLHRNGTAGRYCNMVRAQAPSAFTSGRIRFRCALKTLDTAAAQFGVLFQQSQADMTGASGSAYGVISLSQAGAGGVNTNWTIRKYTAGLPTGSNLAIGNLVVFNAGVANVQSIEVTWILDLANLGGLRITVKRGVLRDFSDLVLEPNLDIIVTSSVLTTSVGEGPCLALGGTTDNRNPLLDTLSCVPLLVGG